VADPTTKICATALTVLLLILAGCGTNNPISSDAAKSGQGRLTARDRLFIAEFDAFPNLDAASEIRGWNARGSWVVSKLQATAAHSQRKAIALAKQSGAVYRSEWIANSLIFAGEGKLGGQIASLPGVNRVWREPFPSFELGAPSTVAAPQQVIAPLRQLDAPTAWENGITGKGVTIGVVDTGVNALHPALRSRYRGYRGANEPAEHDYNWFAPITRFQRGPVDVGGHGTQIAGSILGGTGLRGGAAVGVAPGAEWIAAAGCSGNSCPLAGVLPALQFMLAPTDRQRREPRPELRPEIVANSWQRGSKDLALERAIRALEAAGVLPIFAVGNEGPACGSARSPGASPDDVLSVGAVDRSGQVTRSSGRGPGPNDAPEPDVVAPGVDVVSSEGRTGYASADGTSSAAAFAAGMAALVLQAEPTLRGNPAAVVRALRSGTTKAGSGACGATDGGRRNNSGGYGQLNAPLALAAARREAARLTAARSGTISQ
jgi:subtilisin family serine protease